MLAQPAQSLTDLLLGIVVISLAVRAGRVDRVHRHWRSAFWWAGAAAGAGAVHHGVIAHWPHAARVSWAIISVMVVIAVSYLLAGTVVEVLGPGKGRVFWMLRSLGLFAYVVLAATGHAGVSAMLSCESLTMSSVLVLWGLALYRRHPLAPGVLLAIAACGVAGAAQALSPTVTARVALDPTSVYHLLQIVGMILLYRALSRSVPSGTDLVTRDSESVR